MNPERESFEKRLRNIRPAAPPPDLMARLLNARPADAPAAQAADAGDHRPRRPVMLLLRRALPFAAALVIAVGLALHISHRLRPDGEPSPEHVAAGPLQSTDCLLGARELGIVHAADGRLYRVVHGVGLGIELWKGATPGMVTERAVPRQRVLLVSMNSM